MSTRPFSEKTAEILFNRFLLQSFPLGGVQLFAPSSIEELKKGYDTKILGCSSFRELYLQFKAPQYSESRSRFTIFPTLHQHRLLQELYPPHAAYYVAPMFRSLKELNEAQTSVKTAADFLKNFICIEIAMLPPQVDFFHYIRPSGHRESPLVKFKTPNDGQTRTASHSVSGDGWLRGSALLAKFKEGKVGVRCDLTKDEMRVAEVIDDKPQGKADLDSRKSSSGAELAVLVRIPEKGTS